MHHSGTSAFARAIGLCGAADRGTSRRQRRRFREPREIVALHDEALAASGASWGSLNPVPQPWFGSDAACRLQDRLAALIAAEYGDAPLIVVKDPRLCRVLPLWHKVLERVGIDAEAR